METARGSRNQRVRSKGWSWARWLLVLVAAWSLTGRDHSAVAERLGLDFNAALNLGREYLAAETNDRRADRLARLAPYAGDFQPVIQALGTTPHRSVEGGYYPEQRFESSTLGKKYPLDLLYFVVPKGYDANRPTGLIVFLHGGGFSTSRDAPMYTLRAPEPGSPGSSSRSGDMLAATGMITVGPSAPGKRESSYRWCLRSSEEYLADVIVECKGRFNIDPDRVFLLGHSMGGFGAYHQALRQPDRFAAIIISSGAWDCGYWPAIRGTPVCIVQGVNDAQPGVRWHHTDVAYARFTHSIFTRESLQHVYYEHDGGHGIAYNRAKIAEYFAAAEKVRRDPYFPHIALASPQGFASNYLHPVRHNRWLTLDEAFAGQLTYDELVSHGDKFDEWRLEHRRTNRLGAMLDAVIRGNNRIEVTAQNVARFTVWLHPKMVDISRPVTISVNGAVQFAGRVEPTLATALQSYERRRDWGMIYPIKVELQVNQGGNQ